MKEFISTLLISKQRLVGVKLMVGCCEWYVHTLGLVWSAETALKRSKVSDLSFLDVSLASLISAS